MISFSGYVPDSTSEVLRRLDTYIAPPLTRVCDVNLWASQASAGWPCTTRSSRTKDLLVSPLPDRLRSSFHHLTLPPTSRFAQPSCTYLPTRPACLARFLVSFIPLLIQPWPPVYLTFPIPLTRWYGYTSRSSRPCSSHPTLANRCSHAASL